MKNYTIYNNTLLYMALYLKSHAGEPAIITDEQYTNYVNLVIRTLDIEKSVANAFTYAVKKGEPSYNFNMVSKEKQARINATTFYYDPEKRCYHTPSSYKELYYKSIVVIPQSILPMFQPEGYERAIGLKPKENIQITTKSAGNRTSIKGEEPGDN